MKSQNKYFSFITFLAFLFITFGCKSNEVNAAILNGMIYDADNQPVPNVTISTLNNETTFSDVYGHFTFNNLIPDEDYELHLSKNGYESQTINFTFNTISSVMYIRMYSISQLLSLAEDNIDKKDYDAALQLLDRAETIPNNKASTSFLRAIVQYRLHEYDATEKILLSLLNEGYKEQSIYLFLADLYENELPDAEKAAEALQQALSLNYNPEIENRLNKLYD